MPSTLGTGQAARERPAEPGIGGTTHGAAAGSQNDNVIKTEIAGFLRARRARLTPRQAGLPDTGRRRTPGLRRQEVAQLAGMSVDYYIRLEQGRGPRPSRQVLSALARALMLTADERDYLFRMAGEAPPPVPGPVREITPGLRHLLDSMPGIPAPGLTSPGLTRPGRTCLEALPPGHLRACRRAWPVPPRARPRRNRSR
jgi:transcriptional regulator with XRE-family HTH domain